MFNKKMLFIHFAHYDVQVRLPGDPVEDNNESTGKNDDEHGV
jgi:hypothetical protein